MKINVTLYFVRPCRSDQSSQTSTEKCCHLVNTTDTLCPNGRELWMIHNPHKNPHHHQNLITSFPGHVKHRLQNLIKIYSKYLWVISHRNGQTQKTQAPPWRHKKSANGYVYRETNYVQFISNQPIFSETSGEGKKTDILVIITADVTRPLPFLDRHHQLYQIRK